jgi:hypothetical protein
VGENLVSFLCMDDILLATNDKDFLYKVKQSILYKSFDMKDMGDVCH